MIKVSSVFSSFMKNMENNRRHCRDHTLVHTGALCADGIPKAGANLKFHLNMGVESQKVQCSFVRVQRPRSLAKLLPFPGKGFCLCLSVYLSPITFPTQAGHFGTRLPFLPIMPSLPEENYKFSEIPDSSQNRQCGKSHRSQRL